MHQFFVPHIDDNNLISLPDNEVKHFNVLRLTEKDNLFVTDGKGTKCKVKVKENSKRRVILEVIEKEICPKPSKEIIIAIAPTKGNDRFEWFLEKVVEIGVTKIIPFYSEFSERKKINLERIQKIMVAALKQSMGCFLPKIENITSFSKLIDSNNNNSTTNFFMAHCRKKNLPLLKEKAVSTKNACVMIGPEGGFSDKEITMAAEAGWQEISLGQSRLRTETAGITAALTIKIISE